MQNIQLMVIPEGEEKEQGIETMLEKITTKLSEPGERKSHASSGSTEDPSQDEPKEVYSKMHPNKNAKL